MRDRNRLVLNASLTYLANRGLDLVVGGRHWRTAAFQIQTELQLTPAERAEAIEIADDMEEYFGERHGQ